jgi:16S rRNA (guanine527-N7)-methyltransferase
MAKPVVRPAAGWPLEEAAARLVTPLSPEARGRLAQWLDLLTTWNARVNLTAARTPDELVDLMVADACVLASRVERGVRVVDVGTGAGAPGLALALLRPDLAVTLVEPLGKRTAFLRTVVGTLGLSQVTLDPRKGEDVAGSHARGWNVALARATLAPAAWLDLGERLVSDGGSIWVFLAKEPAPFHDAFEMAEDVAYEWPLTAASRRLVRYACRGGRPSG